MICARSAHLHTGQRLHQTASEGLIHDRIRSRGPSRSKTSCANGGIHTCMLVLIGATLEGKKELIAFQTGMRESAQSWKELLVDLRARGLAVAPQAAIGDGALGF